MDEIITTVLITGLPGVGKTTLVRYLWKELEKRHFCRGFYTEEVRTIQSGATNRIGFDVVPLEGERAMLSRISPKEDRMRPKVGKYYVYVDDFEMVALPLLDITKLRPELMIIDEVGKMEMKSKKFTTAVYNLIDKKIPILATIPDNRWGQEFPLVEHMRKSPKSKIFEIRRNNRDQMKLTILEFLEHMLQH